MDAIPIAELTPELPDLAAQHIRGVVTLIWPYSSSARNFALLLGDPDFRRRRRNGQVRVRFSGSGARAIASTGVGIGDEVVLALRGVEFVRDSDVSTPGKSIDWELEYGQTLGAKVLREGGELAVLELDHVAPTPAPASPVRATPRMERDAAGQWNSPAYLKRLRLSDGPVLAPFDPFANEIEDAHAKKRRRRSYRDWNAWTYLARTPSPEKEDTEVDMDGEGHRDGSPTRPVLLPATPVSPSKTPTDARIGEVLERGRASPHDGAQTSFGADHEEVEEHASASKLLDSEEANDELVRDDEYYDLYAAPDEQPPEHNQAVELSATESDTEEQEEEEAEEKPDVEVQEILSSDDEPVEVHMSEVIEETADEDAAASALDEMLQFVESHSDTEAEPKERDLPMVETSDPQVQENLQMRVDPPSLDSNANDAPLLFMPPPTLSLLQTDFHTPYLPGTLTPIGKEPSSPNLQPLDSSTLPMPSPFPGGRDGNVSSYLDYISTPRQSRPQSIVGDARQEVPDDEADYILETSFYSSVSSARAPAFQPTHESAFTDVRFTFGMDGATFSRPQTSSGVNGAENQAAGAVEDSVGARESSPIRATNLADGRSDTREDYEPLDTFLASSPVEPRAVQRFEPTETAFLPSSSEARDDRAGERSNEQQNEQSDERPDEQLVEQSNEHLEERPDEQLQEQLDERLNTESDRKPDERLEEQPDVEMADEAPEERDGSSPDEVTGEELAVDVERDEQLDISMAEFTHDGDDEQDHVEIHRPTALDAHVSQAESDRPTRTREAETEGAANNADSLGSHTNTGRDSEVPRPAPISEVEVIDLGSSPDVSDSDEDKTLADPGVLVPRPLDLTQDKDDEEPAPGDSLEPSYDESDTRKVLDSSPPPHSSKNDITVGQENSQLEHVKAETIEEIDMIDAASPGAGTQNSLASDLHSVNEDVKMESVEEVFGDILHKQNTQDENNSTAGDDAQLLIRVPAEGHKVGEVEFVAVPDAAPARSTRSKTKMSTSPEKEAHVPSRITRSRKRESLAPLSQLSQRTASPPATRSRGTVTPTPTQESFSASPYSLRSQSKHLSPTETSFAGPKKARPPKRSTQTGLSAEPSPQQASFTQESLVTDFDFPWTNFGPSQELGTLQGKFANIPYVKDSEEGSVRSGKSLSTAQYSDDWNMGTNFSDPPAPDTQVKELSLTPRKTRTTSRQPTSPVTPVLKAGTQVAKATRSASKQSVSPFATQLPLSSPTKSVRSISSLGVAPSSPRRSRRVNKGPADLPAESDRDIEMESSPPIPSQLAESIATGEAVISAPSSPQAENTRIAPLNEQSALPITPEATQHTLVDSQPSFRAAQDQTFPMTPQLTQSMSATHRSLEASSLEAEDSTLVQPPSVSETTPRRNATATDVASPAVSPRPSVQSASEEEADVVEVGRPSIGLSTPIAYYTPLRDLPYFINRSSSFHSAGSPDVLALVTTASTPPTRATKGPKHHNTTLHITDLSLYPSQATVQIFRAYANALPVAEAGDVILLRAFNVKSLNRHPCLISADESAWCVWRYGKPLWGKKRGAFGEVRSREEVKGPAVERGEGEWREVEKVRAWWVDTVKGEVEEKARVTRSMDKEAEGSQSQTQALE